MMSYENWVEWSASCRQEAINRAEDNLEKLWKEQGGIDPVTGEMWLTPRMERRAEELRKIWDEETEE